MLAFFVIFAFTAPLSTLAFDECNNGLNMCEENKEPMFRHSFDFEEKTFAFYTGSVHWHDRLYFNKTKLRHIFMVKEQSVE